MSLEAAPPGLGALPTSCRTALVLALLIGLASHRPGARRRRYPRRSSIPYPGHDERDDLRRVRDGGRQCAAWANHAIPVQLRRLRTWGDQSQLCSHSRCVRVLPQRRNRSLAASDHRRDGAHPHLSDGPLVRAGGAAARRPVDGARTRRILGHRLRPGCRESGLLGHPHHRACAARATAGDGCGGRRCRRRGRCSISPTTCGACCRRTSGPGRRSTRRASPTRIPASPRPAPPSPFRPWSPGS